MNTELLNLFFDNNFLDATHRHYFTNNSVTVAPSNISPACARFNGNSYLITSNNLEDFLLGATPYPHSWLGPRPLSIYNDNDFTLDCWVCPETGGRRYYPICSAFSSEYWGNNYKSGWVLQIDTVTGRLQMINYYGNTWTDCLWSYNSQIPFNQWTHITLMSWRIPGQSAPSAKMIFKNGSPIKSNLDYFPKMGFTNGISDPSGNTNNYEYAPFYVGLGPSSQLTDPGQSWVADLSPSYFFCGLIDSLRICLGYRPEFLNTDGLGYLISFSPPGSDYTSTSSSTTVTTSTTTAPPVLTQTTSTSPILTTSTTPIPQGYTNSLLSVSFNGTINDATNRHTITDNFVFYSYNPETLRSVAYFNGLTEIEYLNNVSDWDLNSNDCDLYCDKDSSWSYFCNYPDNHFTIDCWINVIPGGSQYYPICSSFNSVGTGWILQINTSTGVLQFVGFSLQTYQINLLENSNSRDYNGNPYTTPTINMLMESNFVIPINTWVHIAVTSYRIANQISAKIMYLNGAPDRPPGWISSNTVWSSRGQVIANNPYLEYGTLKVGSSLEYTLPMEYYIPGSQTLNYFKGFIRNLEISNGNKFPVNGSTFIPPQELYCISTSTSSSTTITSTTTLTTISTTTTTSTSSSTSSLFIPLINELLICPFINNNNDITNRHYLNFIGNNYSIDNSIYLDGNSMFVIEDNLPDFMLGSTPYRFSSLSNFTSNNRDNHDQFVPVIVL